MSSAERFSNIDGLRAIAALSVFWQHAAGDVVRSVGDSDGAFFGLVVSSLSTIDLGRFGVVLFFLISGFVVPFSFKPGLPVTAFALSRAFRLFPAFWVAVLALALLHLAIGQPFDTRTIAANMTMMPNLLGSGWMSGIYWTLFVELLFYFAVAALFMLNFLYRPAVVFLSALVLMAATLVPVLLRDFAVMNLPVQYVSLHLSFLFSGLLLRLAMVEKVRGAGAAAAVVLSLQLVAVYFASSYSMKVGATFAEAGVSPVWIAYVGAIAVFCMAVIFKRPESRMLTRLGVISYSIYLFHGTISGAIYQILPLTGGWSDVMVIGCCLAATLIVSWLVYSFIEKPGISLGREIVRRYSVRKQVPLSQA